MILSTDINECEVGRHNCLSENNRTCNNTNGGFECICSDGYEEDSNGRCMGEYSPSKLCLCHINQLVMQNMLYIQILMSAHGEQICVNKTVSTILVVIVAAVMLAMNRVASSVQV